MYPFNDGLQRAAPESVGIDPAHISDFLDDAKNSQIELNGFMLYRSGSVIAEGWWWPYLPDLPHVLHSATKSFLSVAVGLAIHEGYFNLNSKVVSFFPDRFLTDNPHLLVMTVEDLLTQTSGHSAGASGGEWRGIKTSWIDEFFKVAVTHKPGTHFRYSSATSFLLSAIVQTTTGQPVRDFLEPRLFRPLGIKNLTWDVGPENINPGGNGISCLTSDFLKLGILHLQKGLWNGQQILPESWVEGATSSQRGNPYGYHWWIDPTDSYYAAGMFGQFSVVFPEYNAVLVTTAAVPRGATALRSLISRHFPKSFGDATSMSYNRGSRETLRQQLRSLRLLQPFQSGLQSPAIPEISKERFVAKSNSDSIISFVLDFEDDFATFHLQDDRGFHHVRIGLTNWCDGQTSLSGAELHHGYEVAQARVVSGGRWKDVDTFEIVLQFNEMVFRDIITLRFGHNGKTATLDRSVNVNTSSTRRPTVSACVLVKGDEFEALGPEDFPKPQGLSYSTATSTIGELLDNDTTRDILNAEIPDVVNNPRLAQARRYTFDTIHRHIDGLTVDDLARIDQKLAKI